jgi:hypothetical protein
VGIPLVWRVELAVVVVAMLAAAGEAATLGVVGAMGAVVAEAMVEVMAGAVATPVAITGGTVATVNLAPVTQMCKTPLGWMSAVRNRIHLIRVWMRENFLVVRATMVKAIL